MYLYFCLIEMRDKRQTKIREKREEKKKLRQIHIDTLCKLIKKYNKQIPLNEIAFNLKKNINTNSWFDIYENNSFLNRELIITKLKETETITKVISCDKLILLPNDRQKKILLKWMNACRIMYNDTLKYFKIKRFNKEKYSTSFKKLRTYVLNNEKKLLVDKYDVPSHMLDGAIKLACASLKSALTNLKLGNIRHFTLRYIKQNKKSHVMCIEQAYLKKNSICPVKLNKNQKDKLINNGNIEYDSIKKDCMLHYNESIGRFTLLMPKDSDVESLKPTKNYIAIDPGVRTFMTCLTNENSIEIGNNSQKMIKDVLLKIDNIAKKKSDKKLSKKLQNKLSNKLQNKITDLHWKSINYLLKFKNIIIGNWSTKSCSQGKLNKMTKRIMLRLRYYDFLSKLRYKCNRHKVNLKIVDESYSSKICSNCGNEHKTLGGSKKV
jgi:IS605 OrfB family transposase